jgi:4-amino-4-deoxy-L-arabinose transferase-like glycosyltransferase
MTETLPQRAIEAKALAYRNRSRRNWVWLGGVLCGMAAAGLWLVFFPDSVANPKTSVSISVVLGLVAAGLTVLAGQKTFFPETAKCPSCGYGWELTEGRYVPLTERMETWDRCPGCGFPMSDVALERALHGES